MIHRDCHEQIIKNITELEKKILDEYCSYYNEDGDAIFIDYDAYEIAVRLLGRCN